MNKIRELRNKAGLGLGDVADAVGADLAEVALAEMGVGLIRFDLGMSIARALSADPGDVFPKARELMEELSTLDEDEMREAMLEPRRAAAIASAGLDPDIMPWYAIVTLRSGNERRYFVSSSEAKRIKEALGKPRGATFISFLSDCRHVLVRPDAITEIRFTNTASYARFSSDESAFEVVLVSAASPRPEWLGVLPDGEGEPDARPFADLLDVAATAVPPDMPAFVSIRTIEGDDRFVALAALEVIEVSVGVLMPSIYDEASEGILDETGLAGMEVMGSA